MKKTKTETLRCAYCGKKLTQARADVFVGFEDLALHVKCAKEVAQ